MPRRTLQVVAALIFVCAAGGFALGLRSAANQPALPGDGVSSGAGGVPAADALPLLRAPREPEPEPEPEEEVPEETSEEAAEETAPPPERPLAPPPAKTAPAPAPSSPPADQDRVGDLIDGLTPQELPPF